MSLNNSPVSFDFHDALLGKFSPEFREKLGLYTAEELFYVHKICTFQPKRDKNGDLKGSDILLLAMKAKILSWLRGQTKYPVYPSGLAKLGARWKSKFNAEAEFVDLDQVA